MRWILVSVIFFLPVVMYVLSLWAVASVITSSIKTISDDCGSKYGVEAFGIEGSLFCTSNEEE